MSHYSVNASVPKTLIQHVIRWLAQTESLGRQTSSTLLEILATPISPELIPGTSARRPSQPRYRGDDRPLRAARFFSLLHAALWLSAARRSRSSRTMRGATRTPANGPTFPPLAATSTTSRPSRAICTRSCTASFKLSQFKRSAIPNAPKVGSGGSLSPRGDWRAPSDSEAIAWLDQLKSIPDKD